MGARQPDSRALLKLDAGRASGEVDRLALRCASSEKAGAMRHLLVVLVFLSVLAPSRAHADEPLPTLRITDEKPPPSVRTKTLLLGGAAFLGAYGLTAAASVGWPKDPGASDLLVPLLGPWLKAGQTTLCKDLPDPAANCSDPLQVVGGVASVLSGVVQFAAFALLVEGVLMKTGRSAAPPGSFARGTRPWSVGADFGGTVPPPSAMIEPSAMILPLLTPSSVGLGVVGTF